MARRSNLSTAAAVVACALGPWLAAAGPTAAAPLAPTLVGQHGAPASPTLVQKRRGLYDNRHLLFQLNDTNSDDRLTSKEYARGQLRTFVGLDGNGDGRVDAKEYKVLERFRAESVAEEFAHYDLNRDGILTKDEYLFGTFATFRKYDVDRNNIMTPEEIPLYEELQKMMTEPRLVHKHRRLSR